MSNPVAFSTPSGLTHLTASVLWSIIPQMMLFSATAVATCLISIYVHPLEIATTLLTVFGTLIGFLVSFRTSSAFASYSEGRRYWAQITLASRTLARIAWLHVPSSYINPPTDPAAPIPADEARRALIEKKSAINLIAAFSIATQHYCRGEAGIYYEDLFPLVCYLPRYRLPTSNFVSRPDLDPLYTTEPSAMETLSAATFANISASASTIAAQSPLLSRQSSLASGTTSFQGPMGLHSRKPTWSATETLFDPSTGGQHSKIKSPHPLLPARNPPPISFTDNIPFLGLLVDLWSLLRGRAKSVHRKIKNKSKKRVPINARAQKTGDNVPLELTIILSAWIAALQRRKSIDVPTINSLLAAVQSLSDALTGLERVLLSPIPAAYSIHLRHVIWLYLLFLAPMAHATMGWLTVPATAIAAFCFLGFLDIGNQIENPLGYDKSDLDLESFTSVILRELQELTAHPIEEADPARIFFDENNLPFATGPDWEGLSATQIIDEELPIEELEAKLRKGGGQAPKLESTHPYGHGH